MSENNHRPCFHREDGVLFCEGVSLLELSCRLEQTTYVYSRARIERNYLAYEEALADVPHAICYAMKANSTAGVLQVLARLGAGVDTVSGGEIARALRAGFRPEKIVYSGVGKTAREITFALKAGIGCFNVESEPELERINRIATELGVRAPISIRCNPDVDPKTHPYISTGLKNNKFGIAIADVEDIYLRAANMPGIEVRSPKSSPTSTPCTDCLTRCPHSATRVSRSITSTWAAASASSTVPRTSLPRRRPCCAPCAA